MFFLTCGISQKILPVSLPSGTGHGNSRFDLFMFIDFVTLIFKKILKSRNSAAGPEKNFPFFNTLPALCPLFAKIFVSFGEIT